MSPRKKTVRTLGDADGAEPVEVPLIHIVKPLETHEMGEHKIDVRKPVQLHVVGEEGADFKHRFPGELLDVVRDLRDCDERKINIYFENKSPQAEFIYQVSHMMGFYRRGRVLCIDTAKFDEFAAKQG